MFTGIVETLGRLTAVQARGDVTVFSIEAPLVAAGLAVGDSVAVNGTCLTAVAVRANGFDVELVPETLRCTNLGALSEGGQVNLERSLAANGRFGGHIVQGHVDGAGEVLDVTPDGEGGSVLLTIRAPQSVLRYVVQKGYVTVDGMSLTIVDLNDDDGTFRIALIPYTLEHTVAGQYTPGTPVNLEADILGKFVERLVTPRLEPDHMEGIS